MPAESGTSWTTKSNKTSKGAVSTAEPRPGGQAQKGAGHGRIQPDFQEKATSSSGARGGHRRNQY
eukprot:11490184-Heterocapsa_arctica.AAC.1